MSYYHTSQKYRSILAIRPFIPFAISGGELAPEGDEGCYYLAFLRVIADLTDPEVTDRFPGHARRDGLSRGPATPASPLAPRASNTDLLWVSASPSGGRRS